MPDLIVSNGSRPLFGGDTESAPRRNEKTKKQRRRHPFIYRTQFSFYRGSRSRRNDSTDVPKTFVYISPRRSNSNHIFFYLARKRKIERERRELFVSNTYVHVVESIRERSPGTVLISHIVNRAVIVELSATLGDGYAFPIHNACLAARDYSLGA